MEKEIKEKTNLRSVDVFFIGDDLSIFNSLKSLSTKLESFFIEKTSFSEIKVKHNNFFIMDDSEKNLAAKISFFQKRNFQNFFILSKKENLRISQDKNYKVFLKPLKIFELHKEICKKVSKNIEGGEVWKLDRSKLKFYKNKKNFIRLTEKEFYFLFFLIQKKGVFVTKGQLLSKVWNLPKHHNVTNSRVVETLVSKIRKKLIKISNPPKIIKNKLGYKILI